MTTRAKDGAPREVSGARRPRLAALALAAGAAILLGSGVVACQSQSPADVGAEEAQQLATATPTPSTAPPGAGAKVPVTDGTLPDKVDVVRPVTLKIPGLQLTAKVDAVGVNQKTDEFDVPPSVDRVGWYRFGPGLETRAGSVVIAGHVDGASQGKGAFFGLRNLDKGDRITATGTDGKTREYRVVAREEYDKSKIPLDRYFARDGAVRLTLITCGGPFDSEARRYKNNVVVTATPV